MNLMLLKGEEMRIHEFTIIGQNAWNEVYLFSTIDEDINHNYSLKILYGGTVYAVDLADQEDIIQRIRMLEPIDNKYYDNVTEDCGSWCLRIAYDDKEIVSGGRGATPGQLYDFLSSFGCEFRYRDSIKGSHISKMTEKERIDLVCDTKGFNRFHIDVWDRSDIEYDPYVYESFRPGFFKVGIRAGKRYCDAD